MALFDFASAFPSVSHKYLLKVLEHYRMPDGLKAFFGAQYANVLSFIETDGNVVFFCRIAA
eukprot:1985048-Karenia_brevis.AAC.1